MKKLNLNKFRTYINTIPKLFRYMLLAALVLFISLFFPNSVRFDYTYEQGDSWRYEDLRAPFAFPIKKSDAEISRERKVLERELLPSYRLDKALLEKQKEAFTTVFRQKYSAIISDSNYIKNSIDSSFYHKLGLDVLHKVYEKHIIKVASVHFKKNGVLNFRLIERHIDMGEHSASDFWDAKAASEWIVDTLNQLKQKVKTPELLLTILVDLVQKPDIEYDAIFSKKNKELIVNNISPVIGKVNAGELIIRRNEIVDSLAYTKLISYQEKYDQEINKHKNSFLIYLGYLMLTIALLSIFTIFIRVYHREIFDNLQHLSLILVLIAGYSYLSYTVVRIPDIDSYFIPFCIVPIIVKNFFSSQMALFTHLVVVLIASMLLSLDYQFILVQIIVGMVAIMTKRKTRYLTDFFFSVLYIGIAYTVCYLSLELIHRGAIGPVFSEDGQVIEVGVQWGILGWIGLNVLLTMLSYPFIPLLERAFGLISEITLVELSDLNKPLLKELSFKAPGTMQHSLQVANLAEAAADEIGANALLVKVGALYHDIGKMLNPQYYIENQNEYNPHQELTYLESARMIISHVTEGEKLGKKYGLPSVLIDFIRTHHGTTRVEYFYRMYKNENPDKEVSEGDFIYPGPKPRNREEAILMISDSLEAASKTLKNPTGKDIDNLVENIVAFKISHGQLQDTNLTFRELDAIKGVYKRLLRSIRHVRIEYPEEKA